MRFRMDPIDRRSEFTFPPWILMEFHAQEEVGHTGDFHLKVEETSTGTISQTTTPSDFKTRYQLLNTSGMKSEEPDERKVGELDRTQRRKGLCLAQLWFFATLISVFFVTSRIYCFSCYKEYKKVAV